MMDLSVFTRNLRFLLLWILRGLLRWRSRPLVLSRGATVAVIAPHPDDEVLGCGLLLAHPPAQDMTMHVIFLTRGEASHPGHPALNSDSLARRRSEEAGHAAGLLGLPTGALHFLDLPDGNLAHLDATAIAAALDRIGTLLNELKPTVVLVPDARDGSTEHAATARLLDELAVRGTAAWRRIAYVVWSAWSPRLLARIAVGPGRILRHQVPGGAAAKRRAALAYGSQVEPLPPWKHSVLPLDFVAALARDDEFFIALDS